MNRFPYYQGYLIAAFLEGELRSGSKNAFTIDSLLFSVFRRARASGKLVDDALFTDAAPLALRAAVRDSIRSFVVDGNTVPVTLAQLRRLCRRPNRSALSLRPRLRCRVIDARPNRSRRSRWRCGRFRGLARWHESARLELVQWRCDKAGVGAHRRGRHGPQGRMDAAWRTAGDGAAARASSGVQIGMSS